MEINSTQENCPALSPAPRAIARQHHQATDCLQQLFFAVLVEMGFHRLLSVSSAVNHVRPSDVSMVCSLLVTSGLVMLGRFPVVASGMRQMF
jgi:hypothetical protein